jgi:hypothetical protein
VFSFATKSASNARPSQLTLISANSFTSNFTLDSNAEVGDIVVIWNYEFQLDGAGISDLIPSGFTKIITTYQIFVNTRQRGTSSYKVVTESDLNTTFTGFGGSFGVLIFRCPKVITSASVNGTPSGQATYNQSGSINQSISSGTARSIMIGVNNWTSDVKLSTETGSAIGFSYYLNDSGNISNSYAGSYTNTAPNYAAMFQSYQVNLTE